MASDEGHSCAGSSTSTAAKQRDATSDETAPEDADGIETEGFLTNQANQQQNFTLRGVLVGLVIGVVICFSNTYFGLQTGWVSGMTMPAALIGFAYFKAIARWIDFPFTPVENVLVQTVAGAVGTMPLGCGFVGVMPALNFLMTARENGPLILSTWKLIVWALGLCFFGVVIAVPLRRQVIIRERLKFPSGTATALMIGVLHGRPRDNGLTKVETGLDTFKRRSQDVNRSVSNIAGIPPRKTGLPQYPASSGGNSNSAEEMDDQNEWKAKISQLIYAFIASAAYVGFSRCCVIPYNCTDLIRHFSRISFRKFIIFPSLDYL